MRRLMQGLALVGAAVLAAAAHAGPAPSSAPQPQRIVSLNMCTDQLLVDLVPRTRIAGVSWLATDRTLSAAADRLTGLPQLKGEAEEVLALKPDLIIAGEYTTPATVDMLRRLGQRVLLVPMATDFDGMRASIRQIGDAVGEGERAESMIAAFDKRIAAAHSAAPALPTALAYQVNSLVAGPQSLLDAALQAAGYRNLARDRALGAGGRLPLEDLLTAPPDLLVLANAPEDFRTVQADNLRHPALQQLLARRPSLHLPMPYWMCATPRIAEAVEMLASIKAQRFTASARVPATAAVPVP